MAQAPKYVSSNPGVAFYDTGENQGSDYRHYAELKEGWVQQNGRNAGGTTMFFNTRFDFLYANPVLLPTTEDPATFKARR